MALPEYQRTILRQVQEADMSSANVWKTLANTLDNYSSQLTGVANTQMSNFKSNQAASKASAKAAATQERLANERATAVFVNSKESDVMTSLSNLSVDFNDNYAGYIEAANKLAENWSKDNTLDSIAGMRVAFETMVSNKIQQYGEAPYKNFANKQKKTAKIAAEKNVNNFVDDAIHSVSQFINNVNDGTITPLDDVKGELYAEQTNLVEGKYLTLQAKIDELIINNNYSAADAIKIEQAAQLNFYSGVIKSQIDYEMKVGNGWRSIDSFRENPNKFIKSREHLSALFPESAKMNNAMASTIYEDMLKHYKETLTQKDYAEKKAEEETLQMQSDNFSQMLYDLVDSEIQVDDYTVKQMLKDGDINNDHHDFLIKAIGQDTYVKDDPLKVFDLNKQIIDTQSSYQDKEQAITDAVLDGDIGVTTALAMLTKASTSSEVTNKKYFQIGWNAIESALVADLNKRTKNEGDVTNAAQEEYYNRVQGYTDDDGKYFPPEDGMSIYQEIVDKYRPLLSKTKNEVEVQPYYDIDTKVGASFAEMEFDKTTGWNTFFVGTPDKVQAFATKVKVGELVSLGLIPEFAAAKILKQLKDYVVSQSEED
jgi:hypothetical protein